MMRPPSGSNPEIQYTAQAGCLLSMDLEDFKHASCVNEGLPHRIVDPDRTEGGVDALLQVLNRASGSAKITVFTTGQVARDQASLVDRLVKSGHEIGCHSDQHENIYTLDRAGFAANLDRAVKSLRDASGQKITGFRAPNFSIPKDRSWAFEAMAEAGLQYDSSVVQESHRSATNPWDAYTVAGRTIHEFPIYRYPLPGGFGIRVIGGTYFRLLPASFIISLMRRAADKGYLPLIYLHPADLHGDFDGLSWHDLRTLKLSSRLMFIARQNGWAAGVGDGATHKLAEVLRAFPNMGTMDEVLKQEFVGNSRETIIGNVERFPTATSLARGT